MEKESAPGGFPANFKTLKMKYQYKIVETLARVIEIEADDSERAWEKLENMYYNGDVVLSADDFENVEFYPMNDK